LINGTTAAGIPFWVFWAFFIGSICSIATVLISVLSTKEIPPTPEELAELRARPGGPATYIGDIVTAVRAMPFGMHKFGVVYLFQWYAVVVYWQFVATSIGESAFGVTPEEKGFEQAAGWVGLMNNTYNFVTIFAALALIGFAARFGAKWIHAAALVGAAIGMLALSQVGNQYVALLPMVLLGIAWASMMGVPYILVASMVPKERLGVYMGIVNMMIVVPMLIQTVTFGWIFENVLGGDGTNAIVFAGVLFGIGAVAMLFVSPPRETEESEIMPLGAPRRIDNVYNRVVVGSDGTPNSLKTVGHAAGVAAAADADLFVVSAYNPQATPEQPSSLAAAGEHQELYGEEAAREAIRISIKELKKERARNIDHRIVAGTPAEALLEVAGSDPSNLIVVGNRGLGAAEGEALGSVPREVVKNAVCNVMVVQTGGDETLTPGRGG
jgi:maltose/moltooligosaccharide transporter